MLCFLKHVRIAKVDKKVKMAKMQLDGLVAKKAKLDSELAHLQARISVHAADFVAAHEDIEQAERQREELYAELQHKQDKVDTDLDISSVQGILAASALLPDEAFKKLCAEATKEAVQNLLEGLVVQVGEWQQAQAKKKKLNQLELERVVALATAGAAEAAEPGSAAELGEDEIMEHLPGTEAEKRATAALLFEAAAAKKK